MGISKLDACFDYSFFQQERVAAVAEAHQGRLRMEES
jgi:hypothetical protein